MFKKSFFLLILILALNFNMQGQFIEKYRRLSTDIISKMFNVEYYYELLLYQDGQYQISLSAIVHTAYGETSEESNYQIIISSGSYVEKKQILLLTDKNFKVQLKYQLANNTNKRQSIEQNSTLPQWIPIKTFPFLQNVNFSEDTIMHFSYEKLGGGRDLYQAILEFKESPKAQKLEIGRYLQIIRGEDGWLLPHFTLFIEKGKKYKLFCAFDFLVSYGKWEQKDDELIFRDKSLRYQF